MLGHFPGPWSACGGGLAGLLGGSTSDHFRDYLNATEHKFYVNAIRDYFSIHSNILLTNSSLYHVGYIMWVGAAVQSQAKAVYKWTSL